MPGNPRQAFLAGSTSSSDFPTITSNGFAQFNSTNDAFLAQIDTATVNIPQATGTATCNSPNTATVMANSHGFVVNEYVRVAIDPGQNGTVFSGGPYKVTAAANNMSSYQLPSGACNVGMGTSDSSDGNGTVTGGLVYGSHLGGASSSTTGSSVAAVGTNQVYLTGQTYATNFQTQSALQTTIAAAPDAFVISIL